MGKSGPRRTIRERLPSQERERTILVEATRYFAEHGLSAGTTALARRLGITQPLLYAYFPTKEALIARVYEGLLPDDWAPGWELLLDDRTRPLAERLKEFYLDFSERVFTYEHVRLFLFSGLKQQTLNQRYYSEITERIFRRIARALQAEYSPGCVDIAEADMETVQSLHAAIYHVAFRRYVHMVNFPEPLVALIGRKVDLFLDGAAEAARHQA